MTIVALANALLDGVMRTRFHAEPMIQATELLLQERTPRDVAVAHPRVEELGVGATVHDLEPAVVRRLHNPHAASPSVHLLSNGRYSVMLTAAGSGYSRWGEHAVTRWREDTTRDDWGSYVLLRDVASGEVWSAAYQPRGTRPDSYDVMFAEDRAEFVRHDGVLTTTLDVVVSPEDDAEVRRVSIANAGREPRDIELTSFAEIALAPPLADAAHQAFSKLFVQTEYLAAAGAILATRRRRSPGEAELWAAHLAVVEGEAIGEVEIETDRARFLGRGNDVGNAVAVLDGRRLSNTVGAVLDPIFALRRRVRVPGGRRGAYRLLDGRGDFARGAARCHRQASGHQRLRTRGHAGVDAGAGSVAPSRRRARPGQPLSAPRRTRDLRQSGAALPVGYDSPRPRGTAFPVGPGHLGRRADRPGAHRRGRGFGRRQRGPARARVLAPQGTGGRRRHPERARRLLRPGPADRPGDVGPHQPLADASRGRGRARRHLRAAQRPDLRRDPRPAARRRTGGPAQPARRPERPARSPSGAAWRAAARQAQARCRRRSGEAPVTGRGPGGPAVLQWSRWFLARWPRIRDGAGAGPVDAGALDQRRLQSVIRIPGGRRRRRLYLVAEQPRQPAHALVERSGQRPARRGPLRARSRQRHAVDADGAADPPRAGALHRPAWARLQPLRAGGAGHHARAAAVRAVGELHQDLAAHHPQHLRPPAPSVGHGVCRMGARPVARRVGADGRHRARRRDRRDLRAQSLEHASRRARGLRRPGRAPDGMDRRSRRVHRPQLHHRQSRRAERAPSRCRSASAPASIPARPCRRLSSSSAMARPRSSSSSARPATPPRRGP